MDRIPFSKLAIYLSDLVAIFSISLFIILSVSGAFLIFIFVIQFWSLWQLWNWCHDDDIAILVYFNLASASDIFFLVDTLTYIVQPLSTEKLDKIPSLLNKYPPSKLFNSGFIVPESVMGFAYEIGKIKFSLQFFKCLAI